jgi:hypothetical protein
MPAWSGYTFSSGTIIANVTSTLRRLPMGTPVVDRSASLGASSQSDISGSWGCSKNEVGLA